MTIINPVDTEIVQDCPANRLRRSLKTGVLGFVASFILAVSVLPAQETSDLKSGPKYSPEVAEKAEKILQSAGLRRNGKLIQPTQTATISRALSGLAREKRDLRLAYQKWAEANSRVFTVKREIRLLNARDAELNLQLARVANDVTANNRIVGLINASRARAKELNEQKNALQQEAANQRGKLKDAEAAYADTVLAIREDYNGAMKEVEKSLKDEKVAIALRVLNANYDSPPSPSAETIMASLDRRIGKIEDEIFSETIPLQVERGSLYVDVVVGTKTRRMVVDSGAAMMTMPSDVATELGVKIPSDADDVRLILADGRTLMAKSITLPRVRVGEFEASDVEAAVFEDATVRAEPLLGMSFLGNFKFEVDANKKSLTLLRVSAGK